MWFFKKIIIILFIFHDLHFFFYLIPTLISFLFEIKCSNFFLTSIISTIENEKKIELSDQTLGESPETDGKIRIKNNLSAKEQINIE